MAAIKLSSLTGVRKSYAQLLALEYGQCTFLHYGLISEAQQQQDYQQQQQAFADKLLDLAQESISDTAFVLLDGPSLQYLGQQLADAGHQVTLLTNNLESFDSENKFDLVLIEGTYHYLQQLPFLTKARELLCESGRVLIFGEYIDDDSKRERSSIPNLSSMRQLSERLSFSILEELNFTADAENSLEQITHIAANQAPNFESSEEFEDLVSELEKIKLEIGSKRRCFKVFHLEKAKDPEGQSNLVEYDVINSFDPSEVSELFGKSFDTQFNADLWQWKYELGDGKCIIARESKGSDILSHYGGIPRHIQYFGEPNTAIQPSDVMVLSDVRRHYGKSSLFFKTAATFLEREIGNTVNHLLGFGFPNQKAMNIAIRLGLYEKTDDYVELVFPKAEGVTDNLQLVPIDIRNQQHQSFIDLLWDSMKSGMTHGIVGDRHWRYIKYRYFDHPFSQANIYRCVFVSNREQEPLAAIFLKEHEQRMLIMDLICSVDRMKEVIASLNFLLTDLELKVWITKGWVESLRTETTIENNLGIEIPCNSWNPGPSSEILYGAWWLTAGDMDFL